MFGKDREEKRREEMELRRGDPNQKKGPVELELVHGTGNFFWARRNFKVV